ncbi:MAG: hypothetical protein MUO62_19100 [Anaerolineales bacterium]|nr:hypothetical protein [Anaerolineales bacterium]
MQFEVLTLPALFVLAATSIILILGEDWRISISALGVQYIGVFILVGVTWPLEMAVIKLVAGWISAAVLGMELVNGSPDQLAAERYPFSDRIFKLFLAILVGFAIFSFVPQVAKWMLQASYEQIVGGLLLAGMGILHLGVSDRPFRVAVGLLTFLSGFEIIYATVETSAIVAGFLAVFSLGIALIGSYLTFAPTLEVDE